MDKLREAERLYLLNPEDSDVCAKYEAKLTRLAFSSDVPAALRLQDLLVQLESDGDENARSRLVTLHDHLLDRKPPLWAPSKPACEYLAAEIQETPIFGKIAASVNTISIPPSSIIAVCRDVLATLRETLQSCRISYDEVVGWKLDDIPTEPRQSRDNLDGFSLFNTLSGFLDIGESISGCACPNCPCSQTVGVTWEGTPCFFEDDEDGNYTESQPTSDELNRVAIKKPTIQVNGVGHQAPNGEHFTLADLIEVVIETERQTRADTDWMGDIDRHHIAFGGMRLNPDTNTYHINWDS